VIVIITKGMWAIKYEILQFIIGVPVNAESMGITAITV